MSRLIEVYVSPAGKDTAAGTAARPVRSVERGMTLLRQKRRAAKKRPAAARLVLRGGVHTLTRPLVLTPADSGIANPHPKAAPTDALPLTLTSAQGEVATLSGGRRIDGWRAGTINGRRAWVADVRGVKAGRWNFTQLWVNGNRAARTRLPREGLFRIEKLLDPVDPKDIFVTQKRFRYAAGDLRAFANLGDVEFVALHFWIESRAPIRRLDERTRAVELAWPPRIRLTDDHTGNAAPYYVENVREALTEPGQWYLDRSEGRVYYLPRAGERIEEIEAIAPALPEVVRLEGDAGVGRFVDHVCLENLVFAHNEYVPDEAARRATPQAAAHVPGAVRLIGARHCTVDRCTVEHAGSYGIELTDGCYDCRVTRCEVRDVAAGGVKVFHRVLDPRPDLKAVARGLGHATRGCRHIVVRDNHIHDGGHRWRQAVGVLVGRCSGVEILHNHVHDLDYSGVSVGWTWGYADGDAYGNVIEWNHIHDIGRGALSDMGAIYTLGPQPGTRIRFNRIHDVESRGYGGWGIYPDEGSSHLLIEHNLVYRTKHASFHTHYGRGNTVRNNIFAFGRHEMVALGRYDPHNAFTFERNIVLTEQPKLMSGGYNAKDNPPMAAAFRRNLYFCTSGEEMRFFDRLFAQWQALGKDAGSVIADPRFHDARQDDFTLDPDSPAIRELGFEPLDLRGVGPREATGAPE